MILRLLIGIAIILVARWIMYHERLTHEDRHYYEKLDWFKKIQEDNENSKIDY